MTFISRAESLHKLFTLSFDEKTTIEYIEIENKTERSSRQSAKIKVRFTLKKL